jgi:hypothetical protein
LSRVSLVKAVDDLSSIRLRSCLKAENSGLRCNVFIYPLICYYLHVKASYFSFIFYSRFLLLLIGPSAKSSWSPSSSTWLFFSLGFSLFASYYLLSSSSEIREKFSRSFSYSRATSGLSIRSCDPSSISEPT